MLQHRDKQDQDIFSAVAWALAFAGSLFVGLLGLYFFKFHGGFSSSQEVWGQFGDFLGGSLNPVLGFVSVVLLAFTLRAQHRVLEEARRQGVLEEVQRLLATYSQDIDRALRQEVAVRGRTRLWHFIQSVGLPREPDDKTTVLDAISAAIYAIRTRALNNEQWSQLEASGELQKVMFGLHHLDRALAVFQEKGGDPAIAALYGGQFEEPILLLACIQVQVVGIPYALQAHAVMRFGLGEKFVALRAGLGVV